MAASRQPALHRFFEAVAAIMDLGPGRQRLELTFEDGRLVEWQAQRERRAPVRARRLRRLGLVDRGSERRPVTELDARAL
jgi:hypothetical protein